MRGIVRKIIVSILQFESKLVIRKYKPHIVAVVGSVGKTTTKDAIYTALSPHTFVRKSDKSHNSEIGIPLTILGVHNAWDNAFRWVQILIEGLFLLLVNQKYPKWLVLEIGADRPGDIKSVARWIKPDIEVYTRLPDTPVHIEFFESVDAVTEEKLSLIPSLKKVGTLIINGDDERLLKKASELSGVNVLTYGFDAKHSVHASHYVIGQKNYKPTGVRFRAHVDSSEALPTEIHGVLGRQHVYPALAALAVGHALGYKTERMVKDLGMHVPQPGRMKIIDGIKGSVIIDDTYNSSPIAMYEALNLLEHLKVSGKKIAVVGDMLELGKHSAEEHKKVGRQAASFCDLLITVGLRARAAADGALLGGMSESNILQYDDVRRAGKELESLIEDGDVILVKGSQSVRAEKVVGEIMAEPRRKRELLVRQEEEWTGR